MPRVSAQSVTLSVRIESDALSVDASSTSAQPITIAAHPKYFAIEIEDERGQFVAGVAHDAAPPTMPRAADYVTIAPGARATVFRASITRAPNVVIIGDLEFSRVAGSARVRVTYHASDRVLPNLPRDKQRTLFAGPADAIAALVPISSMP